MLGSAHCGNCGRSLVAGRPPPPIDPASASPAAPPSPSFDAPPPPPVGWTLADGPGRQALLPPPTHGSLASALRPPKDKKGCGCGVLVFVGIAVVVAAIVGVVVVAIDTARGERVDAPALSLGDSVRFDLGANDTSVHPLALGEGAVTITVRSLDSDFDPVLEVKRPDGDLVGSNDDAIGRDSQLSFALPEAADFLVEVHEFTGDPGEYEVEVTSGASGPVLDPTDVVEGERIPAGELRPDQPLDGSIGTDDTAVHALAGFERRSSEDDDRVSISVVGVDGFDPVLRVVDQDGTEIGENDDADGRNSFLTFELRREDRFEVEVREFSGDAGSYTIRLQEGDGTQPAVVPGPPLRLGEAVEGDVGDNQVVRHRFAGDGVTVQVDVVGVNGFDPVVRVLGSDGELLGENDDTDGRDAHVEVPLASAAVVTIEVFGFNGQPGRYRVTVS